MHPANAEIIGRKRLVAVVGKLIHEPAHVGCLAPNRVFGIVGIRIWNEQPARPVVESERHELREAKSAVN